MRNIKTVPNQKVVKVEKEKVEKGTKRPYTTNYVEPIKAAARDLQAGAFKLYMYFAINAPHYEFALSSKAVEEEFGMKIKQYNNAVKELEEKGYLHKTKGNYYFFYEKSVITKEDKESEEEESVIPKGNNAVITKKDNAVITKGNNALLPKETRNNINNIKDNINNNIREPFSAGAEKGLGNLSQAKGYQEPISKGWGEEMDKLFNREGNEVNPPMEWLGF